MRKFIKNTCLLLTIAFFYEGNTLYWKIDGEARPEYYLRLQLDKLMPPTVNQDPIEEIIQQGERLVIFTKDKYWILHFSGNPINWWVEDWNRRT